ncbi:DUF6186 family protein [Microbacterium ulmi]|uniref:Uncharacterized protein n=1 Tax=Microbacterium ulmi TaxID=179095 RepID=A0A7Y2PZF5_9MICO|nr:DUF6186 family protein [Microbacterium ulmi]NII69433.1 membrane glycosyltransferase [Microbacterium ulmi]NNH04391.1 hypothetical protein [Microbacterium ulmi]
MLSATVFVVGAIVLGVVTWISSRRDPEATASGLFDRIMQSRTVRIAILVCWWWLGWHFLVAQTVDPGYPG